MSMLYDDLLIPNDGNIRKIHLLFCKLKKGKCENKETYFLSSAVMIGRFLDE